MTPYREFPPQQALRPFVDRFWVSYADANASPRRILPDGCIDVIVDLTRGAHAVAVGAMTRATLFDPRAPVRAVAVRFRPGGAPAFLKLSADALTDRVVDIADIGVRWLVATPLQEMMDPLEAVQPLEQLMLDQLASVTLPDPMVAYATTTLFGPDPPSIQVLSQQTGWTRQHLGRVFQRHVGVRPKQLARVARLQRAIVELQRHRWTNLADAALRLGYFDQAHMALDFRELAGVTPLAASASAGSIFPIRSLLTDA